MARLHFYRRLRTVAPPDGLNFPGWTVGEALKAACRVAPLLRSYMFDEFGAIYGHVAVAVDHEVIPNDTVLGRRLKAGSDIYVLDARAGPETDVDRRTSRRRVRGGRSGGRT